LSENALSDHGTSGYYRGGYTFTMKTALEIVEAALDIERELREKGFVEKEICGVTELVLRANSTVIYMSQFPPLSLNPAVQ